ncbi:MAG: hypothetical protein KIT76_08110 [Pseudolabrys sp.]|nr:hypothetical protein [Pseudolabrys sp.]MCW5697651.1 hypothetical protein [Bauldia sp.]
MREHFDLAVFIPLEEELQVFLEYFEPLADKSSATEFRYEVDTGNDLRLVVVNSHGMGKGNLSEAVQGAIDSFDFSLGVCLGIAGTLSNDLSLGDICYTGTIIDVYENSKAVPTDQNIDLQFSPVHYPTPRELTAALNFIRTLPENRAAYNTWLSSTLSRSQKLVGGRVPGRTKLYEDIGVAKSIPGTIACGIVSDNTKYNERLVALDRKILAIETESGALFAETGKRGIPAITIRGISDYAHRKRDLEEGTRGAIRHLAAANASTFLWTQLQNDRFVGWLRQRRASPSTPKPAPGPSTSSPPRLEEVLASIAIRIDTKLRELSHHYQMKPKGYRLPVPRIRKFDASTALSITDTPIVQEIRDALSAKAAIAIRLPHNYPDASLPWVIADDLLTAEIGGLQPVPLVVDGEGVSAPNGSLANLAKPAGASLSDLEEGSIPVFIIYNIPYESKTRLPYLADQIRSTTHSKFILLSSGDHQTVIETDFAKQIGADVFTVTDISFAELALFLQKNFAMSGMEAEVVALRLRDTFQKFDLSAHPTYFAGIPSETLAALIQVNRRAELIQLAVDGYLTFVVAGDRASVQLSRTTRLRFLRKLAAAINIEKRSFDHGSLIAFTADFASKHDFDIDSLEFIQNFRTKGILHFSSDIVRFSLPFVESYVLAVELRENVESAKRYFDPEAENFDTATFDIYCELGPAPGVVEKVLASFHLHIADLSDLAKSPHILTEQSFQPKLLSNQEKLRGLQAELDRAARDVADDKPNRDRKQRMLDVAERMETEASRRSTKESESAAGPTAEDGRIGSAVGAWIVGVVMLGSGAEHLEADTKRQLVQDILELGTAAIDAWTRRYASIDFAKLKSDLTDEKSVNDLGFIPLTQVWATPRLGT